LLGAKLLLIGLIVTFASLWAWGASEALDLSAFSGKAPLLVRVTGPANLAGLEKNHFSKWVGCGFYVDWGEGAGLEVGEHDCAKALQHTFKKPGTYKVRARTFHPAPDDSHITDWTGEATVVVE
jgi:hypothetical protein